MGRSEVDLVRKMCGDEALGAAGET